MPLLINKSTTRQSMHGRVSYAVTLCGTQRLMNAIAHPGEGVKTLARKLIVCSDLSGRPEKAIPLEKFCDGESDCKSKADETSFLCPG